MPATLVMLATPVMLAMRSDASAAAVVRRALTGPPASARRQRRSRPGASSAPVVDVARSAARNVTRSRVVAVAASTIGMWPQAA
jgi:hypothetical protein